MPVYKRIITFAVISLFVIAYVRLLDVVMGKYILPYSSSYWVNAPGVHVSTLGGGTFTINSLGLIGKEITPYKKCTRILFLGDSMTFSYSNNCFVAMTEDCLNARKYSAETINAGMVGYGPENSLGLYRHLAGTVVPDIVLMCLTSNDVNDSGETIVIKTLKEEYRKILPLKLASMVMPNVYGHVIKKIFGERMNVLLRAATDVPGAGDAIKDDSMEKKFRKDIGKSRSLMKRKLSYREARTSIEKLMAPLKKNMSIDDRQYDNWINNTSKLISEQGFSIGDVMTLLSGLLQPDYFIKAVDLHGDGEECFDNMCKILRELHREVIRRGGKFGIIYLPNDIMYEEYKQQWNAKFNFISRREWLVNTTRVEKELAAFCESEGIKYLNLTDDFRKLEDKRITLEHDMHLNTKGHEKVSELISGFILRSFPRQ